MQLFVLIFLVFSTLCLNAQVSIMTFMSPDSVFTERYDNTHAKGKVFLAMKPGDHQFADPNLAEMLQNETIQRVELVYTDWPRGEDFLDLNRKRFIELYKYLPQPFSNKMVQWDVVKQTGVTSASQLGNYFHGFVIHYRPVPPFSAENATISRILNEDQAIDSTFFKVFERNQHWKDMLVVCDVTGSMAPYLGELMLWIKLYGVNKLGKEYMFFNDDSPAFNDQSDEFGHWSVQSKKFEEVLDTMLLAMRKGDHVETNIGACIRALKSCKDTPNGIIMIADNWENPNDMPLLPLLVKQGIPVHIIICGVGQDFNMTYFEIARKTGGSVHTVEGDIDDLSRLANGKKFNIGQHHFEVRNGYIAQIK